MGKEILIYHTDVLARKQPKKLQTPKPQRMILPSSSQKHSQMYLEYAGVDNQVAEKSNFVIFFFLIQNFCQG